MSRPSHRICVLVGAGIAIDAGLPSSIGLASKLKENLEDESSDNPESKLLLDVLRFLDGGIRFQRGILGEDPGNAINIEQLANVAIRLQDRRKNVLAPYASGWHERLAELELRKPDLLTVFVDRMYASLRKWLTPEKDAELSYLRHLAELQELGSVSLFSLNYDTCIETAFLRHDKCPLVNGFNDGQWDPDLLRDDQSLRLFKLHGSLDWVEDQEFGICSTEFPRHKYSDEFESNVPLLIFGTDHKATGKDPFLTLLFHLSWELNRSDLLVVIGYSFGDNYINQVIDQRLRTNLSLKALVVAPEAERCLTELGSLPHNPARVIAMNARASACLHDGTLRKHVSELLRDASEDAPFGSAPIDEPSTAKRPTSRNSKAKQQRRGKRRRPR